MFECLIWHGDHMKLKDLLFVVEHCRGQGEKPVSDENFGLYKVKQIYDQYEKIFSERPYFQAKNIMEIGIWDGGSLVIWNELFMPSKLVGVDFRQDRCDSKYFEAYIEKNDFSSRIKTYWGTNQADRNVMLEIYAREFQEPLDLIIDDASHFYEETRASFEILFPKLREGGLYIIEDWAWMHWQEFDEHPYFAGKTGLTQLVIELTEMIGSARGLHPASLTVLPGLVAVEKGALEIPQDERFLIDKHIRRRPASKLVPPPRLRSLS